MNKKWVIFGVVGVVVLFILLKLRSSGGGASTGTITQLGPTQTDASIQTARLSAAANAFDALIGAQSAETIAQTNATSADYITTQQGINEVNLAQVTAPAYVQAAQAQAAAALAMAKVNIGPAQTYANTAQYTGLAQVLAEVGAFIAKLFGAGGVSSAAPIGGGYFPGTGGVGSYPGLPPVVNPTIPGIAYA